MSEHHPEAKKVSSEVAARTLSQFSPPSLIYPETANAIRKDFSAMQNPPKSGSVEEKRLQSEAEVYQKRLQEIRSQLSHRALLCIAIDQTERRESGLYVDSSSIRFGEKLESNDSYDLSITNWEFSPDGHLTRGRIVRPSATPEFGAWDIRYIKDASISNAIRQDNGQYNFETLTIDDATDDSMILSYSATHHEGNRPFHHAFTNAPGETL